MSNLMEPVHPVEYDLYLSTGELIHVSELDSEVIDALRIDVITTALQSLLERCTVLTREQLESAKIGDDADLRKCIRSPIAGMLRALPVECRTRFVCAMHDQDTCSIRNIGKQTGNFPVCFEYSPMISASDIMNGSGAAMLGTAVIQAWRAGRHVVIVRG